jgi:hypothetical protein
MKKNLLGFTTILLVFLLGNGNLNAQFQFDNANSRLTTAAFNSGCPTTIVDWNNDGLDDIIRLKNGKSVYVEIQKTNQTFETRYFGDFSGSNGWAWAMCVADFDHNGYADIVGGAGSSCKVMMINNDGITGTLLTLDGNYFVQNCTIADFNNDGWEDLFACDDNGPSRIYINDGAGNLLPSTTTINFTLNPGNIGGDPRDSGNYGSVWTDFDNDGDLDLYIAKCRQSSNTSDGSDPRRVNVMFVNNGDGTYTEDAAAYGINIAWQTWTASFGDIDNDADLDLLLTNHDHESQIMLNDGTGHYTDISATAGVVLSDITPIQSVMEDFDNDGFMDILVAGSASRLYHNNGNNTFTRINGTFDNNDMESFSIGDLNHDGLIDIYASYANIYTTPSSINDVIWLNSSNTNTHFLNLDLEGTASNLGAIGAKAMIYGSWGVQMREVRAGESYGTVNSSMLHFGIGSATEIDSVVVQWPSGVSQVIDSPQIDQFLSVIESTCIAPEANITSPNSLVLCQGQTLQLNAPQGYEYLWSTGETTQTIQVATMGEYNVRVSPIGNTACASVSKTITVALSPDETPSIAASGETTFCNGGSVVISAPTGLNGYSWSNGATGTNSITVNQSGSYSLSIQGACATFSSTSIDVVELTPAIPSASDVFLSTPGTASLVATGDSIQWYDAPGGNLLGTGNTFSTPVLSSNTTYYAVNVNAYGGGLLNGGLASPLSTNQFGATTTNAKVYFNVNTPCTLRSFTVYTDTPGARKFDMYAANGTLLNSATATLVSGSNNITLNFNLAVGTGYYLMTDASFNQTLLGQNSPRLQRENNGGLIVYPYLIGDLVSITSNQFGNQYYFYYYNIQVEEAPAYCSSDVRAVNVVVDNSTSISENMNAFVGIYPNPADKFISVTTEFSSNNLTLMDAAGRIIKNQTISQSGTFGIDEVPAGIYLLRVANEKSNSVHRLVIQ